MFGALNQAVAGNYMWENVFGKQHIKREKKLKRIAAKRRRVLENKQAFLRESEARSSSAAKHVWDARKLSINKNGRMSSIFPARDMTGLYTGSWGIGAKDASLATSGQMFKRSALFAFGGAGYKREALLNSFGLLSKQQKVQKGIGAALQRKLIPGVALYSAYKAFASGNGFEDIAVNAGTLFGGSVGMRTGQSLAMGLGRAVGMGRMGMMGAGIVGMGLGAIAGAAIIGGAAYTIATSTQSNNWINKLAASARSSDFHKDFVQTDLSLTHRQRALEQISKSAMNNRGQILGNEASVLNGLM